MSARGEQGRLPVRRVVAFGALWAAISGAALLVPGCYGRNCEGDLAFFGPDAGQGELVSEDMWESGPVSGDWLWFPRQRYYVFDIPALGGRTPWMIIPYISPTIQGSKNGGNATIGSGNVAELLAQIPNHVELKNDTCSDYYLRLAILLPPLPPNAPGVDSGTETNTGVEDAGVDSGDAESGN